MALAVVMVAASSGCVGVGTRICAKQQEGCDFTDHVLTVFQSGTVCPTWNVRFAQYNRWTRGGWQDLGVSMFLLDTEHGGLKLAVADIPSGDEFVAELLARPRRSYTNRGQRAMNATRTAR